MHAHSLSVNRRQLGFSLPEIMVGMVIGLLGIIIIMQVTSVFEGQKRTTTGGDDAQNGGAIALYALQRDVSQAGYGISSSNVLTMPSLPRTLVTPFVNLQSFTAVMLNPVQLNGVRDPETDTFIVTYGSSNSTPEGAVIINSTPAPYTIIGGAAASGVAATGGGHSFTDGDYVTVDDGNGNATPSTGLPNTHYLYRVAGANAGAVPIAATPSYSGVSLPSLQDNVPVGFHPVMYNLGASPTILAYAVRNGSLSSCDYLSYDCGSNAAVWLPLAGGIVSMRLECVGGASLRVALVARNSQPATSAVTTSVPTWNPSGASQPVAATPATSWATPGGVAWDHYRYKKLETLVPIRNAIWGGAPGC